MPIFIYNSLTRKKEELIPIKPQEIKMYVCGPTVYDEAHIGHARSAYIFDVIRRYLIYREYKVKFVRNVTDVDDKIIDKAQKEFKNEDLNLAAKKVSTKYLELYHEDMLSLGILEPDVEPLATEYVAKENPLIQKFIEQLIKNGYAYVSENDVYFDIRKAKDYGKLSNQAIEKMEAGARIARGEKKKDPLDFALWKSAKAGEPAWDSPWGKGRPGWHIECSVMSSDILGDEFDIHGGGIDLIFPHHENEIAQSEGAGKKFARYWIHHGLLTINGQKMSKSLGNFITVKGFMDKYKDADLLKLAFLSTHYLHPVDFTEEKIDEARKQKKGFDEFFYKVNNWGLLEKGKGIGFSKVDKTKIDTVCLKFKDAMDDDFNTPQALACLFELVDIGSQFVSADKEKAFNYVNNKIKEFFNILGIKVKPKEGIAKEGIEKIRERDLAKRNRDFVKADLLRNEIKSKFNYIVIDTGSNATIIQVESDKKEEG
ncbi:MAG: cysteine--tRNA ligase [Candidatus Omnitrophota bacterium]|nr:cysteine--tRNA ligase [Candidatus Omnitrophota bacterium]